MKNASKIIIYAKYAKFKAINVCASRSVDAPGVDFYFYYILIPKPIKRIQVAFQIVFNAVRVK